MDEDKKKHLFDGMDPFSFSPIIIMAFPSNMKLFLLLISCFLTAFIVLSA